ncbi:hypothetical protein [Arthrobacter sp. JCM 19049]|uniref:hypothetical protein n=1 Tax=Arthrobacter sp. JCM 19049 TaxID=1460643 RepID=UPI000A88D7B1|nr:hypothetical protein [Arthrobacter sp. JCM 19049]
MSAESGEANSNDAGFLLKLWRMVREIVVILVIAIGLSLIIKTFFFRAYFIPSVDGEHAAD